MAAAVTVTPGAPYTPVVVTGSGFANNTVYAVSLTHPDGSVAFHEVTSNGSGAFTLSFPSSNSRGTATAEVRPAAEHNGTTAATASGSAKRT